MSGVLIFYEDNHFNVHFNGFCTLHLPVKNTFMSDHGGSVDQGTSFRPLVCHPAPSSSSKCSINIRIVHCLVQSTYLYKDTILSFCTLHPLGPTGSHLSPQLVVLCPSQVLPFLPLQFPNHSVARNICNPLSGIVIFGTTDCWRAFADCRGGSSYLFPWWLSRTGPTMGIGDIAIAVNYFQSILARPCSPKSPLYPVSCSFGILVQLTLI